jgi:hypothetical protein
LSEVASKSSISAAQEIDKLTKELTTGMSEA